MAYGYTYKRDSGGRHVQMDINALNPGAFNLLARNLERMGRNLGSQEARSEASRAVAEDVAEEAMKIVRRYGADRDLDGHRITSVLPYRSKGGLYGVVMKSPQKENSEFPDAYYLEYGYGTRATEHNGRQPMADRARKSGKKKRNTAKQRYVPGATMPTGPDAGSRTAPGEHRRALVDKATGVQREGWFYYDQWQNGRKRFSTGLQGIAAMYRGTLATKAKLRNGASDLHRRIAEAVSGVMTKGVR